MNETCCREFQEAVDKYLIRHRSILDITSKLQEASARVNRAVAKAITNCGCITVNAKKQDIPEDITSYHEVKDHMQSHLDGVLCEACKDILESEAGSALFYLTALLNSLDIDLQDVIDKEQRRLETLGIFRLT